MVLGGLFGHLGSLGQLGDATLGGDCCCCSHARGEHLLLHHVDGLLHILEDAAKQGNQRCGLFGSKEGTEVTDDVCTQSLLSQQRREGKGIGGIG